MVGVPLVLRTWLRYVVPLTVLSSIALSPVAYIALKTSAPGDVLHARQLVRIGWLLAGTAIAWQLLLVAAVTPAVRSIASALPAGVLRGPAELDLAIAAGTPLSQLSMLTRGLASLARALVPWLVAIAAVLLGGLALVVPGVLLLVLLSLTGASDRLTDEPARALADSVTIVRAQLPRVAMLVALIVAVDLAIAYAAQLALVPAVGKKVAAAKLVPVQTFVRAIAVALVVLSPLAACTLAAAYERAKRRPG
jgi:hypothetical protein